MSPFKLGLGVLWAASWTALPIKMAFALLFIAMGTIHLETMLGIVFLLLLMSPVSVFAYFVLTAGMDVHLGEGVGLPILFLLSIPVDIWALGLVARTDVSGETPCGAAGFAGVVLVGAMCARRGRLHSPVVVRRRAGHRYRSF